MALSTGELIFVLFPAPFSIRSVAVVIGRETTRRSRRVSGSVALMHGRMAENRPGAPPLWRGRGFKQSSYLPRVHLWIWSVSEAGGLDARSARFERSLEGEWIWKRERELRFTWGHDSHGCNQERRERFLRGFAISRGESLRRRARGLSAYENIAPSHQSCFTCYRPYFTVDRLVIERLVCSSPRRLAEHLNVQVGK